MLTFQVRVWPTMAGSEVVVPVVEPADVRMVWIPPHKSKKDPNTLVGGHWVYVVVRESGWFIDAEDPDKGKMPLIIPYKESAKK